MKSKLDYIINILNKWCVDFKGHVSPPPNKNRTENLYGFTTLWT